MSSASTTGTRRNSWRETQSQSARISSRNIVNVSRWVTPSSFPFGFFFSPFSIHFLLFFFLFRQRWKKRESGIPSRKQGTKRKRRKTPPRRLHDVWTDIFKNWLIYKIVQRLCLAVVLQEFPNCSVFSAHNFPGHLQWGGKENVSEWFGTENENRTKQKTRRTSLPVTVPLDNWSATMFMAFSVGLTSTYVNMVMSLQASSFQGAGGGPRKMGTTSGYFFSEGGRTHNSAPEDQQKEATAFWFPK